MNIIIPLAGFGTRFASYNTIKPLISINGKPMIAQAIKSLGIRANYHFVIRYDEHSDELYKAIKEACVYWSYPYAPIIHVIDKPTQGPACTALIAAAQLDDKSSLIIANCDQIMEWNPQQFLHMTAFEPYDGLVVTYTTSVPHNSYARVKHGYVEEIQEKVVISDISLNGIHYWKQTKDFVTSATRMMIDQTTAPNGEYYVGPTYNYLINRDKRVGIYHIPNDQHWAIGTPDDMQRYLNTHPPVLPSSGAK